MRLHYLALLLLLLLGSFGWADAGVVKKPGNVAVFTARPEPIGLERIRGMVPKAKVQKAPPKEGLTSYSLEWDSAKLVLNVKDDYDYETQREGMLGWLSRFPKAETASPEAAKLATFIPSIKNAYACILPQGFDQKGEIAGFLLKLAAEVQGMAFSENTFFDQQGYRVIGAPGAALFLGPAGRSLLSMEKPESITELIKGQWDSSASHLESSEEATFDIELTTVDEFMADGGYRSVGTTKILFTPKGAQEGIPISFDFVTKGKWEVKNEQLVLTTDEMKSSNHRTAEPALKEVMDELIGEICAAREPDLSWVICRDRDFVLLQDIEGAYLSSMKRKKAQP